MEKIQQVCYDAFCQDELISGTWSNPRKKADQPEKCTMQPITIKDIECIQFVFYKNNQAFHHNIERDEIKGFIKENCANFKQLQLYTVKKDYTMLLNKKNEATIKTMKATKTKKIVSHNRTKQYVLNGENAKAFLIQLGLMDQNGEIKPTKYDKYKQINKYLETIEAVMRDYTDGFIRIVDFGCGKSYLTFAMYYYLTEILHKTVEIIGLDLKKDVIAFCTQLATDLGYEHLKFQVGDIGDYTTDQQIDMVVSLHACNTATDIALSKAVDWRAKIILAVPCCHQECYQQIDMPLLSPILKHGILKERIAALVTDGLRGQLLELVGYRVTIMEFIDMQHTPKNILIKAVQSNQAPTAEMREQYEALITALNLNLTLNKFLNSN